ncbi:zinc finger protein 614 isoform X2 [Ictalurus punctatus]|uniref:Zinc finger protein 614 isoform X2 n=1 Tax=Ictalurus punctatus TaxID=7998 RepID=A0A2D0TAM3_ICTPU|nr:zinc finger protein 614 isoform X2 [Ictalurus punctatus]XP_053508119.1 zinc finger protein 614 isoform X2 [Ictalurus furcatus]
MSSVDIHSQLASILERFAKGALVEMTKLIDKDSALLRAEIARRQMEVEALLCKLQFAESELRSARQAAASRQSAPNRRSVAVQVTITAALQDCKETHTDTHIDTSSVHSSNAKEDRAESFQIKEERTELMPWDNADEIEETRVCWEDERNASNTSGRNEAKPGVIWDSPDLEDFTMRPEASQDTTNTVPGHHSTNASPNPREDNSVHYEYQQSTECDAGQQRLSRLINTNNTALPPVSEQRGDGVGTGEKSSCCAQCGKTFTTRFYLKIHQRIHTGERPYTCLQCGKRFYCNSHLISHQRCHTGEKPYSCEECGKSYSHLNSLKLHQRSHTEEEVCNYW